MQECESSRAHNSQKASTSDRSADLYNPSSTTSTTSLPSTTAPQGESIKKQLPQLQHCNLPRRGGSEGSRLVDCSGTRIQWQTYQTPKGRENNRVRCLDNRLGSQLPGSPDRGPMGSEGSPDAYQLVRAEGSLSSIGNICSKLDELACPTVAGQLNRNRLNKQKGSPHSKLLSDLAVQLWEWCLAKGITVRAEHIPGVENVRADRESRRRSDPSDWRMDSKVFLQIFNRWGPLQVDLFAARHNAQLPQYFSFKSDPGAVAVDAFAQDWSNLTPYTFPPFLMVGRCLQKIWEEKVE